MESASVYKEVLLCLFAAFFSVVIAAGDLGGQECPPVAEETSAASPSEEAVLRLAGGLRIPTVGDVDYAQTNRAPFDDFKNYLRQAYPRIYAQLETATVNEYGLIFHWRGRDAAAEPLLFLSHYDVVPAESGDASDYDMELFFQPGDESLPAIGEVQRGWTHPPFSGAVANGRVYGRGALDMKGMLFALLESVDALLDEGFIPRQDIWLAFGHDEETGGRQGAVHMAEEFRRQNLRFAAVFDEGGLVAGHGAVVKEIDRPLAVVGLGEKGFLTLRITVHGLGGHSSMPPGRGTLVLASEIVQRLAEEQMPTRILPPVAELIRLLGDELAALEGIRIPESPAIPARLEAKIRSVPAINALLRTTTAPTIMRAGDAVNVLPTTAEITVNFRLLPGDSIEDVQRHVEAICRDYHTDIEVVGASREASSITPSDSPAMRSLARAIREAFPEAMVAPYITVGGTDAYKYQGLSENIFRFMPVELNAFEQRMIHNDNEHITLESYGKMIRFFTRLMRDGIE